MNDIEKNKIKAIVYNIQEDFDNVYRATIKTHLNEDCEIEEPKIFITMTDYRNLCRLAQVRDTLSKSLDVMRKEQEEQLEL